MATPEFRKLSLPPHLSRCVQVPDVDPARLLTVADLMLAVGMYATATFEADACVAEIYRAIEVFNRQAGELSKPK